jgi:hypothetical protein
MPQWQVGLHVYGPVVVSIQIRLQEPKGWNSEDLFYSDIVLHATPSGASIDLIARADTQKLARRAALYFVGQALDVLALDIRLPLYLSLLDRQPIRPETFSVRRLIERDEWHLAFESARNLNQNSPSYLRALSWYRKGLYTEDPFDKFLAFWNSIENVASKYHPEGTCEGKGSKCYIWECFKQVWGICDEWPVITGQTKWIDENYDIRKDIAHGIVPVNIRRVETVLEKLETIEEVAYRFLTDWRDHVN